MSVIFNELRVSPDGTKLIINAEVNKSTYFNSTRIEGVYINNDRNYKESGVDLDNLIYEIHFNDKVTRDINLEIFIHEDMINASSSDLFFVYIKTISFENDNIEDISPDEPEVQNTDEIYTEETYTLGVTFDSNLLYQKSLMYLKDLGDKCHISKDLVDHILNYEMLKSSIETGHYVEGVRIFNRMFKKDD